MTNTKQFKEQTIAEKFVAIADFLTSVEGTDVDEMVEFLQERADQQNKANKRERKSSATSNALQEAIALILSDGVQRMADDVLAELEAKGYEDDHKTGLTIARVRNALSALVKLGLAEKFDADRKKDAEFPKVSYKAEKVSE